MFRLRHVADEERKLILQAEIDDLFATGKRAEAAALLEIYTRRYMGGNSPDIPDQRAQSPYRLIGELASDTASAAGNAQAPRVTVRRISPGAVVMSAPTPEETEKVKALLTAGKGRLELASGDVVENGRLPLTNPEVQMGQSLTPLNPVLRVWLKTCTGYIPITVFEKNWLLLELQAWSTRDTVSEAKILAGGTKIKMYAGDAPPEELEMEYLAWLDCMNLFIKYVRLFGWVTLAFWLEGHREIVTSLREKWGWMVAIRYCQKIRQGVMSETTDKGIVNISVLQVGVLNDVKDICEARTKRSSLSNPYAPGGTRQTISAVTGLPKPVAQLKPKPAASDKPKSDKTDPDKKRDWLPWGEYRAQKAAEARAKRERERDGSGDRRGRGDNDRPRNDYYRCNRSEDRGRSWRDDRGRDRRRSPSPSRRRSRSRSRSPFRGGGARRGGGRGGRGRQ